MQRRLVYEGPGEVILGNRRCAVEVRLLQTTEPNGIKAGHGTLDPSGDNALFHIATDQGGVLPRLRFGDKAVDIVITQMDLGALAQFSTSGPIETA